MAVHYIEEYHRESGQWVRIAGPFDTATEAGDEVRASPKTGLRVMRAEKDETVQPVTEGAV